MKKILLSIGILLGFTVSAQECSDLFISEYVEGWSNNKALEIYNPTTNAIDLSEYMIIRYSNGAAFVSSESAVVLNGTIQPNTTYVVVIDKRTEGGEGQEAPVWDELQDKADGFYCPEYNVSKAMYFNGNDAVVLAKGSISDIDNAQLVDLIGKIGEDPDLGEIEGVDYSGWTTESPFVGVGAVVTTDHSLIRKPTVKEGVKINPTFFDALAEWDSIPPVTPRLDENGDPIYNQGGNLVVDGNWESLGSHDCDCGSLSIDKETLSNLTIYPNPSSNGVFTIDSESNVVKVDVYSSLGQKVFSQANTAGIYSIKLDATPGVYLLNIKTGEGTVVSRRLVIK